MLHELFKQFEYFCDLFFPLGVGLCILDASAHMGLDYLAIGSLEDALGRHDLIGYIKAIAILLYHPYDPVDLTCSRFEKPQHLGFVGPHCTDTTS